MPKPGTQSQCIIETIQLSAHLGAAINVIWSILVIRCQLLLPLQRKTTYHSKSKNTDHKSAITMTQLLKVTYALLPSSHTNIQIPTITLPETISSHLPDSAISKGNDRVPTIQCFRCFCCQFQGGQYRKTLRDNKVTPPEKITAGSPKNHLKKSNLNPTLMTWAWGTHYGDLTDQIAPLSPARRRWKFRSRRQERNHPVPGAILPMANIEIPKNKRWYSFMYTCCSFYIVGC